MSSDLPKLYLARHGDTTWTDSHQHTGRTDLPLNECGEAHARQLGERLRGFSFVRIFTSPLQRASKTCELAGFGSVAEVDSDLIEWDYGSLEGTLTSAIPKTALAGSCFVTAVRVAKLPKTLRIGPTASSPGSRA